MNANRLAGTVQMLVIVELALATTYIHLSLGGQIFTLNALGYLGLAAAYLTIGAYLVIGPHFELGWITKAIEVAIIGLVVGDMLRQYGGPEGLRRAAVGSVLRPIQRRGGFHHA